MELLGAGIFNSYLEEYCGYDAGVKDKIMNILATSGCRSIILQETVDEMISNVSVDTNKRIKQYGKNEVL